MVDSESFSNNTPKISIIVPLKNAAGHLRSTLQSILIQSYVSLEILIIDSLSNDDPKSVVDEFRNAGLAIGFVSEPDEGVYDAMNKGVLLSKGDWLYFLGAGDKLYDAHSLKVVASSFDEHVHVLQGKVIMSNYQNRVYQDKGSGLILLYRNFCHQGIFYRRSVFHEVGFYNTRYKVLADWDFNLRCFFGHDCKLKVLNVIICDYMGGGLSSNINDIEFNKDFESIVKGNIGSKTKFKFHLSYYFFNLIKALPNRMRKSIEYRLNLL